MRDFDGRLDRLLSEADAELRALERAASAGDAEAEEEHVGRRWRRREVRDTEFSGEPVRAKASRLRRVAGDERTYEPGVGAYGSYTFPGDDYMHLSMEDVLEIEDVRPLSERDEYWEAGCANCGSDGLLAMTGSAGASGGPGAQEADWVPQIAGIVFECMNCHHQVFFKPDVWPPVGRIDQRGEWRWNLDEARSSRGSGRNLQEMGPFESHRKTELKVLGEAMSRRDFLKLMGRAAGAAMGSPIEGMSGALKFLANQKAAFDYIKIFKDSGIHPELVKIALLTKTWRADEPEPEYTDPRLDAVTPDIMKGYLLDRFSDKPHEDSFDQLGTGVGQIVNNLKFLNMLKEANNPILGNFFDMLISNAFKAYSPQDIVKEFLSSRHDTVFKKDLRDIGELSRWSPALRNFLKQIDIDISDLEYVSHHSIFNTDLLEKLRDNNLISQSNVDATRRFWERKMEYMKANAAEYEELRKKRREAREARKRRKAGAHLGREYGHEKLGSFDVEGSRPVQALGPFEDRLKDKLGTISEEK